MIENKELFSVFPVISSEFDMVCFDAIQTKVDDKTEYYPLVRYMIRNVKEKKVEAGLTIRVGFVASSLTQMSEFINAIVQSRFFVVSVSAMGTIYDAEMNELDDVNWNDILPLHGEEPPEEDTLGKRVLH